jgi:hypothetical protein
MKTLASLLAMIAFGPACSKKDAAPKKHVASPDYGGEFPDFDLAAIAKKFDGKTFIVHAQPPEVWSFAGGKVTIDDGQRQVVGDVAIDGPCSIVARLTVHDGIQDIKEKAFAWNGGTLYMGEGYGGAKHGDTYVACYGIDSFVLQDGACQLGGPRGHITWQPATCSVQGNQFVASDGRGKLAFEIIGDALVDSTLKTSVAELVPSLEAGKAKLASR